VNQKSLYEIEIKLFTIDSKLKVNFSLTNKVLDKGRWNIIG
jgi:hypothetical protein